MIKVEDVSKTFSNGKKAVDNLSIKVEDGEIVGFIGPNGAGKTTTMKMLTGIFKPDCGKITLNGFDIQKDPMQAKGITGYISDSPDMFLRLKGIEFLNFISDIYKVPTDERNARIKMFSERFGLTELLNYPMQSYSHGERQKMMVTAALVHNPPIWILDEPLIGLDPRSAFELKKMMKEHAAAGNSVLFSTHVLEVAQKLCDKVIIINHGKSLFCGTLDELCEMHPNKDLEEIFLELTENV